MEDDLALLGGPDILDRVLDRSDYVVVSMPASPQTVGWIGEPQLRRMKPSAYLINVARGEIVDEDALYHALARRTIAGAPLDVWYRYPREPGATAPATRPFQARRTRKRMPGERARIDRLVLPLPKPKPPPPRPPRPPPSPPLPPAAKTNCRTGAFRLTTGQTRHWAHP